MTHQRMIRQRTDVPSTTAMARMMKVKAAKARMRYNRGGIADSKSKSEGGRHPTHFKFCFFSPAATKATRIIHRHSDSMVSLDVSLDSEVEP